MEELETVVEQGQQVMEMGAEHSGKVASFMVEHPVISVLGVFFGGALTGIGALKGFRMAKAKWNARQAAEVVEEVLGN